MDILAIHPGALGDLVLFGQLLQGLGGRVRLVCGAEKGRLLKELGAVEEAIDFDALPMHELFQDQGTQGIPRPCRVLSERLGRCDLLVSCFACDDAAARDRLIRITGATASHFLPIRPPADFAGHLLDYWAGQLGVARIETAQWQVPREWLVAAAQVGFRMATQRRSVSMHRDGNGLTWSRQQPRDHATRTPGHGTRFCVIHPGSGSRDKCWPMERFFELARRLRNQHEVLWIVGPTELDWWDQDVIDPIGKEFPLLRCPRLEVLAGVLARCSVFIGNDSGPSHLAAAIGAKTIALFGPTDPRHFAPRGRQVKILSAERLEMISVEQVLSAVSVAWASRP